jgi:hypothetical protein
MRADREDIGTRAHDRASVLIVNDKLKESAGRLKDTPGYFGTYESELLDSQNSINTVAVSQIANALVTTRLSRG